MVQRNTLRSIGETLAPHAPGTVGFGLRSQSGSRIRESGYLPSEGVACKPMAVDKDKPNPRDAMDEQLMARYQEGEEAAFTELVRRYKSRLVHTAYRVVGDSDKAEDVAQETFLRVHRNAHRYRNIAKFSTWIYTIALNVARNELRNTKRKRLVSLDAFGSSQDSDSERTTFDIPDESARPDLDMENSELREIFQRAIAELPVRYRTVFVLRDIQGLSYEEIATIMRMPKGTVKSRMNRARQRFRELITPIVG